MARSLLEKSKGIFLQQIQLKLQQKTAVCIKALKLVVNVTSSCADFAWDQTMLLLNIHHVGILKNLVFYVMERMQLEGLRLSIMHHILQIIYELVWNRWFKMVLTPQWYGINSFLMWSINLVNCSTQGTLMTRQDILNMYNDLKRKEYVKDQSDPTSVDCWYNQYSDKFFFYQQQDVVKNVPFIIGIQTSWMHSMMVKYSHNNVISMDSTFSTNKYGVSTYLVNLV